MPGTTPNLSLPYPLSSEPVRDGAQAIENLAQTLDASAYSGLAAFRNKIMNGAFSINQPRPNQLTTTNQALIADRWRMYISGTGASALASTRAMTYRDATTMTADWITHELEYVATGGTDTVNSAIRVAQKIEGVGTLAGGAATLSFWARVTSGTARLGANLVQNFGPGGPPPSPSPEVVLAGQSVLLDTTMRRYSMTFSLPSVVLKQLSDSGGDYLQVNFWFSAGSSLSTQTGGVPVQSALFRLGGVQLESGNVATPFEDRPPQIELALCQRYYEKSYNLSIALGANSNDGATLVNGSTNGSGLMATTIFLRVAKRTNAYTPQFWRQNGGAGQWDFARSGSAIAVNVTGGLVGFNSFAVSTSASTGANFVASQIQGHWVADAEFPP